MTAADHWTPPAENTVEPAGEWWDAIRVPEDIGTRALDQLGERSGAVIADGWGHLLYFLVPPRTATGWKLPGITVLTRTAREIAYVGVPPAHRDTGPCLHWRIPPDRDRNHLTDPALLHTALRTATAELSTTEPDNAR